MRIIYLTTAIKKEDFVSFSKLWKISLNPSNQNFHNKLIRSLAKNNDVDVISMRPCSLTNCKTLSFKKETKKEDNITWHYLATTPIPFLKGNYFYSQAKKILSSIDLKETVMLTDTINLSCLNVANKLAKQFKLKVIGIVTDSPNNISGVNETFVSSILNQSNNFAGYIALTKGLNDQFNTSNKPSTVIEGIVDTAPICNANEYGKYFFFGGALMKKYGIYNLIEAFNKLNKNDIKLVICGHHGDATTLNEAIKVNSNIINLGLIGVEQVLQLEANSIANINPRPYMEEIDKYSIPSKTLEYLSSGSLTISVTNSILEPKFKDLALWAKSNSVEDLKYCLEKALNMSEEDRKVLGTKAKEKAENLYSLPSINSKLNDFLLQFIK